MLNDAGSFEIISTDETLSGQYTLRNGTLRLESAGEGEASGALPLECAVTAGAEGGFEVPADQAACALLSGQSFAIAAN